MKILADKHKFSLTPLGWHVGLCRGGPAAPLPGGAARRGGGDHDHAQVRGARGVRVLGERGGAVFWGGVVWVQGQRAAPLLPLLAQDPKSGVQPYLHPTELLFYHGHGTIWQVGSVCGVVNKNTKTNVVILYNDVSYNKCVYDWLYNLSIE